MYNQTHLLTMVKKLFKDRKFKIGDNVRTSKYKNIFAKDYVTNWFKEVFIIQIFKNYLCLGDLFLVILTEKKLLEPLTKKNCKTQIKKSLDLKK